MTYLMWAVFGGFILHFLLTNFLTVILKPRYDKFVDTAADVLTRNITIVRFPGGESWIQYFAKYHDPVYQNLSQRFVIAKDWCEYRQMVDNVVSDRSNGTTATIGTVPHTADTSKEEYSKRYRSAERISGISPYVGHVTNKKWPLQKVLNRLLLVFS